MSKLSTWLIGYLCLIVSAAVLIEALYPGYVLSARPVSPATDDGAALVGAGCIVIWIVVMLAITSGRTDD